MIPINNGLLYSYIKTLAVSGSYVIAGTIGKGIWRRPISEIVGLNELNPMHFDFNLYPNPNNGIFNIEIKNHPLDKINLEIYSLLGVRILEIKDFNRQNSIPIDISNYPKGIYLVKINCDKFIYTKRIIVQWRIYKKKRKKYN